MSGFMKGALYARDSILRLVVELKENIGDRFGSFAIPSAQASLQRAYDEIVTCFGEAGSDIFKRMGPVAHIDQSGFEQGAEYGKNLLASHIGVLQGEIGHSRKFSPEYQSLQWLLNSIDEKSWENEINEMKIHFLAERLNSFYKDFDFYDYMDSVEHFENQEDVIAELVDQLEQPESVSGILDALRTIKENAELTEEQVQILDGLVLDLSEVQVKLGKSVADVIAEALERSEIADRENMLIDILQVKQGDAYRDLRFLPLRLVSGGASGVQFESYNHVYHYSEVKFGSLEDVDGVMELLEDVYAKFNLKHPEDFKGHSLSMSDVVILTKGSLSKAFYCDTIGFKELPNSFVMDFMAEKTNTGKEFPINE